jgi:UDP-galactopyranose mutase
MSTSSSSLYLSSSNFSSSTIDKSTLPVAPVKSPDLVCLSHLRWNFVYQRPQHLLSRYAQTQRIFFIEEPIFQPSIQVRLEISNPETGVWVIVPHLPIHLLVLHPNGDRLYSPSQATGSRL